MTDSTRLPIPTDISPNKTHRGNEDSWDDFELDGEEHELLGFAEQDVEGEPLPIGLLDQNRSGLWDSTWNFTNSIIGAGIIGLPFAFSEAGFISGLILLFGLSYVVDWTVNLLVRDGKLAGTSSYMDLVYHCFGKWGYVVISISQFIFAWGAMCAYAVIVGDTLPLVLSQLILPNNLLYPIISSRRTMITLCTLFISLPLSLYRDISALAKTSAVSLLAIVFIVFSVVISGPFLPAEFKGSREGAITFLKPGVFQAIGVISFAFVCHHNSLILFGSLRRPTMDRFAMVTHLSTGFSLLACLVLACGGYLVFTDQTKGNILNNFPSDHVLINFARLAFGANMFLTFPLECFVCREVIVNYLFAHPASTGSLAGLHGVNERVSTQKHVLITVVLSLSALAVALATCDLGFVLELTGSVAGTMLAFILPAACYIKLSSGSILSWKKAAPLACIVFGVVVLVLSTVLTLSSFLTGSGEGKTCSG